jgi:hypothetical protein
LLVAVAAQTDTPVVAVEAELSSAVIKQFLLEHFQLL